MIEARGLARTFTTKGRGRGRGGGAAPVEAVRGIDLEVAPGEIVGFLGPNGAGKTTTLRMLTTLLAPTAGTATVAGRDLRADPAGVRRRIGYVGQGGGADPVLPVGEELEIQARLYGVARAGERIAELTGRLDLRGLEGRAVASLSGGQRRRLDIALGLVHAPPLVFLDEPTAGLDPHSRGNLWEHIAAMRERDGTTVFLTTHYLEEADALCDRVLIIDRGRIVAEGSPEQLKRRVSGDVVTLELAEGRADAEAARSVLAGLAMVREVHVPGASEPGASAPGTSAPGVPAPGVPAPGETAPGETAPGETAPGETAVPGARADGPARGPAGGGSGRVVRLTVDGGDRVLVDLVRALDAAGVELAAVRLARPTLDDVFLTVTGRSLRDAA